VTPCAWCVSCARGWTSLGGLTVEGEGRSRFTVRASAATVTASDNMRLDHARLGLGGPR